MGYLLKNIKTKEEENFTMLYWPRLLEIARKHGWQPTGTTRPSEYSQDIWNGSYEQNDGEIVERDDASKLASALEKALPSLPTEEIKLPQRFYTEKITGKQKLTDYSSVPSEHFFSGPQGIQSVKELIEFARKGAFEIW